MVIMLRIDHFPTLTISHLCTPTPCLALSRPLHNPFTSPSALASQAPQASHKKSFAGGVVLNAITRHLLSIQSHISDFLLHTQYGHIGKRISIIIRPTWTGVEGRVSGRKLHHHLSVTTHYKCNEGKGWPCNSPEQTTSHSPAPGSPRHPYTSHPSPSPPSPTPQSIPKDSSLHPS